VRAAGVERRPGDSGKGVAGLAGGAGEPHHCKVAASPGDASVARRLAGVACQHEEKRDGDKPSGISDFTALKAAYAQATASMTKNVAVASFRA
jgi:hypothetical protein